MGDPHTKNDGVVLDAEKVESDVICALYHMRGLRADRTNSACGLFLSRPTPRFPLSHGSARDGRACMVHVHVSPL